MHPYGCHSDRAPDRFKSPVIFHSSGNTSWEDRSNKRCQYDRIEQDERCDKCIHPKAKD